MSFLTKGSAFITVLLNSEFANKVVCIPNSR